MRAYDDLEALRRRRGARRVQFGAQKRDARGVGGKDARVAGAGLPDLEGEVPLGVGVPYPVREVGCARRRTRRSDWTSQPNDSDMTSIGAEM